MVFRTVLPILVILNAIPESSSVCTPATIGQRKCFKMNGFDDLQWTTCVTKEYLSEKSQGLYLIVFYITFIVYIGMSVSLCVYCNSVVEWLSMWDANSATGV